MEINRFLRPLALVAAISLGLALVAGLTDQSTNNITPPHVLLPDYAARLEQAARLEVTHGLGLSGSRTLSFTRGEGKWQVEQRNGYLANQELVNETLLALAELKALEMRTAQAQWHRALGLREPEELGKAIRFRVLDEAGEELASVLLGKEEMSEIEASLRVQSIGPEKRNFYLRRSGEAQSWLARGHLPRNIEPAAWLSPDLPRLPETELQEVVFGTGARKVKLLRLAGENWSHAGAALRYREWLAGFAGLQPDDVADKDSISFAMAQPLTLRYKNGVVIRFENVGAAAYIWSRVTISATEKASPESRQQAKALQDRYAGWAFRFPASAATTLLPDKNRFDAAASR